MTRSDQPKYRPDIDGLRAVAVLSVVTFHAFPRLAPGGFVGVDVFFVISGFLISRIILQSLERDAFSYAAFYARRIRRIFPALLVVLPACLLFGWFVLTPEEYAQVGKHTAAGGLFLSNLVLWGEAGYFDQAAQTKPLLHLWSLGLEEQFYILWPICLVRLRKVPLAVFGIASLSFAANVLLIERWPDAAFYSPVTRFWELLVGALVSLVSTSDERQPGFAGRLSRFVQSLPERHILSNVISIAGLLLIGATALGLNGNTTFPGWRALLPVCGAAAVIAAGPSALVNRWMLSRSPMILIGLISYPLYLWHWPLLVYLRQLDLTLLPPTSRLVRLGAVAASFGAAYLTYRSVEIRARTAPEATMRLCGLMSLLLAVALAIVSSKGASWRWSDAQNLVAAQAEKSRLSSGADYRFGVCLLKPGQNEDSFGSECGGDSYGHDPSVLLWGDSHAAHLYPGLLSLVRGRGLNLAQLTANSCPPLIDYVSTRMNAHCAAINQYVWDWVRKTKPRTVILAADWPLYPPAALAVTLDRLRSVAIEQVVVVGPVVMFPKSQPVVLIQNALNGRIPERVTSPRFQELRAVEAQLRTISESARAEFVSPLDETCNAEGCIIALHGRPELLLSFDAAHLTRAGSDFVVRNALCATSTACNGGLDRVKTGNP